MLHRIFKDSTDACSLYQIANEETPVKQVICTTPETRSIANDPLVFGVHYTNALRTGCAKALVGLSKAGFLDLKEQSCTVLNILRGGLNFGLREALAEAYGWNSHATAFLSAQREQDPNDANRWHITENSYAKLELQGEVSIILGDVIATGTSLEYSLRRLVDWCREHDVSIKDLVVFTIGGPRSTEILSLLHDECKKNFPSYRSSTVVYFEGRFFVPSPSDTFRLALSGTDLMRTNCLMAPEFIESQSESPSYPLERCTIYDAGSRAFHVQEYLKDVIEYWESVYQLARSGLSYETLLEERCPVVQQAQPENLGAVAEKQQEKLRQYLRKS